MSNTAIIWKSFFDSEVVNYHKALLEKLNPDFPIITLGSHTDDKLASWYHNDVSLYQWFIREKPLYERYVVIEWDTRCFVPLKEFYGDKWDADFATPSLKIRGIDEWHWFNAGTPLSDKYKPFEMGSVPVTCLLYSHECLSAVSNYYFQNEIELKDIFCELRIATLVNYLGFKPTEISKEAKENILPIKIPLAKMNKKSIYHAVKSL